MEQIFSKLVMIKVIPPTDINEHEEKVKQFKRKGKQNLQVPCSEQDKTVSHTHLKRKKVVPDVIEISAQDKTNDNKGGRNRKTKDRKAKKTGSGPGGDQVTTSMLSDPDVGETARETTSFIDVNSSRMNIKSDNKEEETPSKITLKGIVLGDIEEELEGNESYADVSDISQKTEREERSRTIEPRSTKAHTAGGQNMKTNSVGQVEPNITRYSVDSSSTNDMPTKVTGRGVKQICAHCDNPVKDCLCPIGPKGFKKKCPGCPLRFLDRAQWFTHYKDEHGVWCVECDFHHMTAVVVAQHMYVMHKRMLNEEKYPVMKCDVEVLVTTKRDIQIAKL